MPKRSTPAGKIIEAFGEVDIAGAELLVGVAKALLHEKHKSLGMKKYKKPVPLKEAMEANKGA